MMNTNTKENQALCLTLFVWDIRVHSTVRGRQQKCRELQLSRRSRKGKVQGKEEEERKEKDKKRKTNRQEVLMQYTVIMYSSCFSYILFGGFWKVWSMYLFSPNSTKNTPPNNGHIFKRRYIYLGLEATYPGWVVVVPSLYLTVYGMRPWWAEKWGMELYPSRERDHIPAWEKEKHVQKCHFFGGTCFFPPGV